MALLADLSSGAASATAGIVADVTAFFTGSNFPGLSVLLLSVAGVVLGFWLIKFVLRLVKSVASSGN